MGAVNTTGEWKAHPRFARVFLKALVTREMNSGLVVNLVRVAPGGEITPHTHDASTETFYVLAGRGVSRIGNEEFALAPGVCGYALPGVTHSVRNTGDADLEAISIFNPPLT
jgi:mannose-6-phosphate isomerase-like protein (cupin superfamily)